MTGVLSLSMCVWFYLFLLFCQIYFLISPVCWQKKKNEEVMCVLMTGLEGFVLLGVTDKRFRDLFGRE